MSPITVKYMNGSEKSGVIISDPADMVELAVCRCSNEFGSSTGLAYFVWDDGSTECIRCAMEGAYSFVLAFTREDRSD